MTWLTDLKWGAIATILIATHALCYHWGTLESKVSLETHAAISNAMKVATEEKQLTTDTTADAIHDQEIEHPPALVIKQPVWLRPPAAICPVSGPATAADQRAAGGAADPGPGIDLRPELAAFAQKYEAALADCRRLAAEWPQ